MVEVPLESDQAGFEAAVGNDGNEMENGDTQKDEKEGTLLDLGKRRKKLKEKGVIFKLSTLLSKRNRLNSRLLRQSSAIQDLMYSAENMVTVEEEIAQFEFIFKHLLLVHQEYHSLLDEEEKPTDEEWFEEVDERVFIFKLQVHNWLRDAEMERANTSRQSSKKGSKSCNSGSSRRTKTSSSGCNSSRSSTERAVEEKAKLAELIAEAEFLQQRLLVENKAEQLRVQEKLAKAKARSQVYEEMKERMPLNPKKKDHGLEEKSAVATQVKKEHCKHIGILSGKVKDIRNDQRERYGCSGRSIKHEQVNTEGRSKTKSSDVSPDLSRMMCDLLCHQSAPEVEIETFKGDLLEYHYFISVFRKVVELKIDDPHGRLVRLLKYTEG